MFKAKLEPFPPGEKCGPVVWNNLTRGILDYHWPSFHGERPGEDSSAGISGECLAVVDFALVAVPGEECCDVGMSRRHGSAQAL